MRVLEFGDNKAAGYCGRLFQLFGAEVIRVDLPRGRAAETSDRDEDTQVDPLLADIERSVDIFLHTGKQRVSIDYQTDEGTALLARLAGESDIVVSDVSPAQLDRLNWSTFPGALRVSITPFGLTGPYRGWQGFGPIILAMGGYTYLMGDADNAPLTLPTHYVEYQAGQFAYTAALSSHAFESECHDIEVSMLETILSLSQFTTVMWTHQNRIRSRHGNRFEGVYPVSLYECLDGFVYINVVPTFWRNLVDMLGRPELLEDERFASNRSREENQVALDEIINAEFAKYTMAECLELGQRKYRFPIGAAMTLDQVLADEHLKARHYWRKIEVPGVGPIKAPGSAFRQVPLTPQPTQKYQGPDHG